jgi:hypothetical protein
VSGRLAEPYRAYSTLCQSSLIDTDPLNRCANRNHVRDLMQHPYDPEPKHDQQQQPAGLRVSSRDVWTWQRLKEGCRSTRDLQGRGGGCSGGDQVSPCSRLIISLHCIGQNRLLTLCLDFVLLGAEVLPVSLPSTQNLSLYLINSVLHLANLS